MLRHTDSPKVFEHLKEVTFFTKCIWKDVGIQTVSTVWTKILSKNNIYDVPQKKKERKESYRCIIT